jgi:hypothetical protein
MEHHDLTLCQFEARIRCGNHIIQDFLSGHTKSVRPTTVGKIITTFGVTNEWMTGESEFEELVTEAEKKIKPPARIPINEWYLRAMRDKERCPNDPGKVAEHRIARKYYQQWVLHSM